MPAHSQVYRARRKAALHRLVLGIHQRTIAQDKPINSDQRNALAVRFPDYWDRDGNRLMEAGGIAYCTGSEDEILTRHQRTTHLIARQSPLPQERSP